MIFLCLFSLFFPLRMSTFWILNFLDYYCNVCTLLSRIFLSFCSIFWDFSHLYLPHFLLQCVHYFLLKFYILNPQNSQVISMRHETNKTKKPPRKHIFSCIRRALEPQGEDRAFSSILVVSSRVHLDVKHLYLLCRMNEQWGMESDVKRFWHLLSCCRKPQMWQRHG